MFVLRLIRKIRTMLMCIHVKKDLNVMEPISQLGLMQYIRIYEMHLSIVYKTKCFKVKSFKLLEMYVFKIVNVLMEFVMMEYVNLIIKLEISVKILNLVQLEPFVMNHKIVRSWKLMVMYVLWKNSVANFQNALMENAFCFTPCLLKVQQLCLVHHQRVIYVTLDLQAQ